MSGPVESAAAREAMVAKFAQLLPRWLRKSGVRSMDLADAVQEAHVEVLETMRANQPVLWGDEARARHELMRIVSRVALRARRRIQRSNDRYLNIDDVEMVSDRDEQAQVEARVVMLTAIENLDEPTRDLIYAHEVEGQTNVEIAKRLRLKEDAVEKRVFSAKQRLRLEIEQLERGIASGMHGAAGPRGNDRRDDNRVVRGVMVLGFMLDFADPFERALFCAARDVFTAKPVFLPTLRQPREWHVIPPHVPTTALMGALAFVPATAPTSGGPASMNAVLPANPFSAILNVPHAAPREIPAVRPIHDVRKPVGRAGASSTSGDARGDASSTKQSSKTTNRDLTNQPLGSGFSASRVGLSRESYEKFLKSNRPEAAH